MRPGTLGLSPSSRPRTPGKHTLASTVKAIRVMAVAAGFIGGISPLAYAHLTSEHDVQARLEKEGYQQVRDIKFGPEGINAKAVKDGKQVSLVIDSGGNVMEHK